MTTKADIERYVREEQERCGQPPIFEIQLMEKTGREEMIYPTGKKSGFPDTGCTDIPGFYYELDTAIECMHVNNADIRETVYDAGFILCRFPGMYPLCGPEQRMYFVWNEEKQGFFEEEEPELFRHLSF